MRDASYNNGQRKGAAFCTRTDNYRMPESSPGKQMSQYGRIPNGISCPVTCLNAVIDKNVSPLRTVRFTLTLTTVFRDTQVTQLPNAKRGGGGAYSQIVYGNYTA